MTVHRNKTLSLRLENIILLEIYIYMHVYKSQIIVFYPEYTHQLTEHTLKLEQIFYSAALI